jgi:hypothetical protein
MATITKVKLHRQFAEGKVDRPTLTDLGFMSDDEVALLLSWLSDIVAGNNHVGKNKPSWLANGFFIPGTELYRDNDIWHYHCGPYLRQDGPPKRWTDNTLALNNNGKHSAQVYHYSKQSDTIIVLGYSRQHIPFPVAASKKNPLRIRSYSTGKTVDIPDI